MKYQRHKEGTTQDWQDCPEPLGCMEPGYNYRVLPEPAAPKWPQTTMVLPKLMAAFEVCSTYGDSLKYVANAVIEHECSTGSLVPADKVREIEAKARAEGMKDGSVWDSDRDRMVIRETLKSQGISWTPHLVDHVIHRLPK